MAGNVTLTVNNAPIDLGHFVGEYIDCVVGGIVAGLHDTGEIEDLKLTIDNGGRVSITLNGGEISLKDFPIDIIRSTVLGMVAPLKGVAPVVDTLGITISR